MEALVDGLVDLPMPAGAQTFDDLVGPNPSAGSLRRLTRAIPGSVRPAAASIG